MNKIEQVSVSYLRPSRTLETLLLENGSEKREVFVYNFEGTHFRVFFDPLEIHAFFQDVLEAKDAFSSEHELDSYLHTLDLADIPRAS